MQDRVVLAHVQTRYLEYHQACAILDWEIYLRDDLGRTQMSKSLLKAFDNLEWKSSLHGMKPQVYQ